MCDEQYLIKFHSNNYLFRFSFIVFRVETKIAVSSFASFIRFNALGFSNKLNSIAKSIQKFDSSTYSITILSLAMNEARDCERRVAL
jgi:hypothetical protein